MHLGNAGSFQTKPRGALSRETTAGLSPGQQGAICIQIAAAAHAQEAECGGMRSCVSNWQKSETFNHKVVLLVKFLPGILLPWRQRGLFKSPVQDDWRHVAAQDTSCGHCPRHQFSAAWTPCKKLKPGFAFSKAFFPLTSEQFLCAALGNICRSPLVLPSETPPLTNEGQKPMKKCVLLLSLQCKQLCDS